MSPRSLRPSSVRNPSISLFAAAIVASGNISLAGGQYIFCRSQRRLFWRTIKSHVQPYNGLIHREGQNLTVTPGYYRQVHDYFVCDIVHNFFVARTDDVRAVGGWDEDLKLDEHEEFFLRVMQRGFGVAYIPDVTVRHWCARSEHYRKYRDRDYVGLAMSEAWHQRVYGYVRCGARVRPVRRRLGTECLTTTPS